MDDLIACSNCQQIANDVLLMYCDHHLCLKCAVLRLNTQYQSRKLGGKLSIVCKKCKKKTNLDQQSINQINKAKKMKNIIQKSVHQIKNRYQKPYNSISRNSQTKRLNNDKSSLGHSFTLSQSKVVQKQKNNQIINQFKNIKKTQKQITQKYDDQNLTNKDNNDNHYGLCQIHIEQPIMFYCFDCHIHCFCAECVLLGKHNSHNVKVIKKAYILIQKQYLQTIQQTQKQVQDLLQKNKSIIKKIANEKNERQQIKNKIQKQFNKIRSIIKIKQDQIGKIIQKLYIDKISNCYLKNKNIVEEKLKQREQMLVKLNITMKNGEVTINYTQVGVLNYYSQQWTKIQKPPPIQQLPFPIPPSTIDTILQDYITRLTSQIQSIKLKQFPN